jgi:hypothetical protein
MLLIGTLHPHLDLVGKLETELGEHLAWSSHDPAPVVGRAVPLRGVAEDRPRVTRAQRGDDHVVHRRRVPAAGRSAATGSHQHSRVCYDGAAGCVAPGAL